MKSNLEQNFKNAFDKYELPYNPDAWNALNDKLDQLKGSPSKSAPTNTFKWASGIGVALIAVSAIIYAVVNSSSSQPAAGKKTAQNHDTSVAKQPASEEQQYSKDTHSSETVRTGTENITAQDNTGITTGTKQHTAEKYLQDVPAQNRNKHEQTVPSTPNERPLASFPIVVNTPLREEQVYLPEINDICEGGVLPIANKNNVSIFIVSPNGKETEIKASSSVYYTANEAGTYVIQAKKAPVTSSFTVKEAPKADFTIDLENQYENGIPSIPVQTHSEGNSFTWSFEGSPVKQTGTKAYAHFYKKGTHQVTLTSRNSNGCEASTTKSITIDKDYNLLAPTGFMPLSDDSRKNRFIPVALQHRDTEFKMYIIEPRKGSVIFETSSLEGWNGVDATTNQLVEENKSFIWKVILANPEPGEPREYKGIIMRL